MSAGRSLPPKWVDAMLTKFCREEVLENIRGDLYEIYGKRISSHGKRKANLLFIRDVLSLLRPRLIKKVEGNFHLFHLGICKNHFVTSFRIIKHNALFSVLNVAGLAISMSSGLLMILLLSELYSFDDLHEKGERIYRVTTSRKPLLQGEPENFSTAMHWIGKQIEEQIPEVEQVLVLDREMTADLKLEDKGIAVNGFYTTPSFLEVFSFNLKRGNPRTVFQEPGSIVLTESSARKLFGDVDPLEKIVSVDDNPDFQVGRITGIVQDPPANSHLNFEALVSMKTVENSLAPRRRHFQNNPGSYAQSYVYVVLARDANVAAIESAMAAMTADLNKDRVPSRLSLQPMSEFITSEAGLKPGPTFSQEKITMMSVLTLLVIMSACFNYTNLSLARALRRSKEISIRKITGATRFQIFSQFIIEATLLSLFAMIVASGIFLLIKPEFLNLGIMKSGTRAMFMLSIFPIHIVYFLLFAIAVGFLAGLFPALVLSKLKPKPMFNDANRIKMFSGISLRQTLITSQIALSIGLIMCSLIVHRQYKYVLNFDLGYETKNIVNVHIHRDYINALENEFDKIPEVLGTSRSSMVLGTGEMMPADAMPEDRSDTIMFSCNYIDNRYLDMHGFKIVAGNGFPSQSIPTELPTTIIVNETFVKALGLRSPQEAIGKYIWYFDEIKLEIHGVVRDFISKSLNTEAPQAFGFINSSAGDTQILGVKIAGKDLLATMQKIEKVYSELDPVHPFEAMFYDEQIAKAYDTSRTTYLLVSFLAFLAVSISTMGLLGIAVFSREAKMKEICIRKVLGAGVRSLMFMISRNFLIMIVVAASFAIPVTLYIVDKIILGDFLYRANIGLVEILSGLMIVLFIAVLSVGWQLRTAAVQNPADLLREE